MKISSGPYGTRRAIAFYSRQVKGGFKIFFGSAFFPVKNFTVRFSYNIEEEFSKGL
jgi:hypothetical protein